MTHPPHDWRMPPLSPTSNVEHAACGFRPAYEAGALAAGEVHVWRADLVRCPDPRNLEILCEEELERAERIANRAAGARWAQARAILRLLLARYSGLDARALRLEPGFEGKPALAQGGLAFNLSHSGHLALYAFGTDCELGIDVELDRPRTWSDALIARAYGPAYSHRLKALPVVVRQTELLRSWVKREAAAKCSGEGLFAQPGHASRDRDQEPVEIELGDGAMAALACRPRAGRMLYFDWPWRPSRPQDARIPFPA